MNNTARILCIVLTTCVLFAAALPAVQSEFTRLSGKVTDADGNPIAGVEVTAASRGGGDPLKDTTDDKGRFVFSRIRGGVYVLTFSKDGYRQVQVSKMVSTRMLNRPLEVTMEAEAAQEEIVITQEVAERAVQWVRQGNFAEALPIFLKIIESDPSANWARMNAGICFGGLDKHEEALEQFIAVNEAEPDNFSAILLLANTYLTIQDTINAERFFEMAIELNEDAGSWLTLGKLYNYNDKPELAIEAFRKAITLEEELTQAHLMLGASLYAKEDWAGSIPPLERYLELEPDSDLAAKTIKMLAKAHFEVGAKLTEEVQYEKALEHLQRSLELAPDSEDAEEARGMVEAIKSEMEENKQ